MKSKIEIQINTPATREQLIELRDEIRKIEGLEAFDLQLPPAPLTPGKMDGGVSAILLEAVISGLTHFTAEKTLLYCKEAIAPLFKKILGKGAASSGVEAMSGPEIVGTEKWKATITNSNDGVKSVTAYDDSGSINLYTNREYSIDPEHTYAVLIGTSQYDDRANFSPIPPVAGNIDEMYRVLTDKTLVGLPYQNITRLFDENCINIKNELRNVSRTKDIRTLIIYYSGHGQNTGNNQLSLIAKDTRTIDDELHNDIPYSFVEKTMNSSAADQKLIFIDACHSGLAAQGSNSNVFDFEPVLGTFTLASTSAEESSYFKRDAANTYFTTYLSEAFKEGITNSNTMLSLTDLYNYTSERLLKARLPAPVCKTQLKNISADKFYISGNPSFSLEARLNKPKQLYQQGRYEDARREYILLEKEYPDNQALRNEHIEFERNAEFNRLVKEGDMLFFREKDYSAAQSKYREALTLKYDESVRDKIADCANNIQDRPPVREPIRDNVEKMSQEPPKPIVQRQTAPPPVKKKTNLYIRLGVIVIGAGILIFTLTRPKEQILLDFDNTPFSYWGHTKNNKPDGDGMAKYKNGNKYDGEWTNGIREGHGTFHWADGSDYVGYFKNNNLNGIGTCKYADGSKYEGEWVFGVWQGQGKFTGKDGTSSYIGQYYNFKPDGYGVAVYTNGDKYEGNYKNGVYQGAGTYTALNNFINNCPRCKRYSGNWVNNVKSGQGKCFDAAGLLIYEGEFYNDKPVNPAYPQN